MHRRNRIRRECTELVSTAVSEWRRRESRRYVQTADSTRLTDENDSYRLSVESVLFDESAGTGVISLHLANKKQDDVKPFTLAHLIDSYQNKPDITWSTLSSCYCRGGTACFRGHVRRQRLLRQ